VNLHPKTATIQAIERVTSYSAFLFNDASSYNVEKEGSKNLSDEAIGAHISNAVPIIMRDRNLTVDAAKDFAFAEARSYEKKMVKLINCHDLSDEERRFADALMVFVAGNAWWSTVCTRYNGSCEAKNAVAGISE
jgi:hypothetical protein